MGVTATFTPAAIRRRLQRTVDQLDTATLNALRYLGEQCVSVGRINGSYTDQTGNLRSSLGYVIVRIGKTRRIIESSFATGVGGEEGLKVARKARDQLGRGASGYALIVVAGMQYAAKVESTGKDVLTSAEQYAEANLPGLLQTLKRAQRLAE